MNLTTFFLIAVFAILVLTVTETEAKKGKKLGLLGRAKKMISKITKGRKCKKNNNAPGCQKKKGKGKKGKGKKGKGKKGKGKKGKGKKNAAKQAQSETMPQQSEAPMMPETANEMPPADNGMGMAQEPMDQGMVMDQGMEGGMDAQASGPMGTEAAF